MYRRRWGGLAALAAVALLIGVPAQSGATAAPGQRAGTQRVAAAARQAGAGLRLALTGHTRPDVLSDAAPLSVTRDVTGTATVTATATMTATEIATATATLTATATTTPTVTATATPVPTNTATPTRTPRPTHTPTPTPTRTPRPTATPTPRPLSVRLVSVGVYRLVKGHEQRITSAALNTVIRLKIVASVANAAPSGVTVTAIWAIRGLKGKGFYKYQHTYVIKNGSTGLYDDITLPRRFLGVGNYLFAGTLSSHGHVETAATRLKVTGEVIVLKPQHVHYAHLRMTVPPGWTLVFQRDTRGRPATGKDTLIMFSPTRRAAVSIVSVQLDRVPSASDLAAFAPIVMQQEFGTVKNIKTISFKDQIDGHDVFAVQGQVSIGGRASQVISIVTNKARQFYAFSVVNLAKSAPPGEIRDALAAIFGAKLD